MDNSFLIKNKIVNAMAEEYEYFEFIRDDNIDLGDCYDYTHGVYQGQLQAAERIMSRVLKIINEDDAKEAVE